MLKIFQQWVWLFCWVDFHPVPSTWRNKKDKPGVQNISSSTSNPEVIEFTSNVSAFDRWFPFNLSDVQLPFPSRWIWKWKMCHAICSVGRYFKSVVCEPLLLICPCRFVFLCGCRGRGFRSSWQKQDNLIFHFAVFCKWKKTKHWNAKSAKRIIPWKEDFFFTDSSWTHFLNG